MNRRFGLLLFAALLSAPAWAQLPTTIANNRVTPDEPFAGGESAMPVGVISDIMVVGNWADDDLANNAGAVWSFKWNGVEWAQEQKITPPNPAANMAFGWSLAVEEQVDSGEAWLAVGAPQTNTNEGAVHLYERVGDTWTFRQTLTTEDQDSYGFDVDINVDIRTGNEEPQWDLVAGAPAYRFDGNAFNTGTVFTSTLNDLNLWTPGAIPLGAETLPGNNPQYGRSVALDGDVIIAGGPALQVDGNNGAGAVIVFTRGQFSPFAGNTPIHNPDPLMNELNGAGFGTDVDVVKQLIPPRHPTGDYYFVVGAPNPTVANQSGTVYVIDPANGFQTLGRPQDVQGNDRFGTAVRFSEDLESGDHRILAGTRGPGNGLSGAVYVYDQPQLDQPWAPIAELVIPGTDQSPGNTARVCEDVAAWNANGLLAIATSNTVIGSDAVYITTPPLLIDGFENQ